MYIIYIISCLEGLRKATRNLRIVGIATNILTKHFVNWSLKPYLYASPR
jgi:hypothetical protein